MVKGTVLVVVELEDAKLEVVVDEVAEVVALNLKINEVKVPFEALRN